MIRLVLICLLFAGPALAEGPRVIASLSQNAVSITTNFNGSEIFVFGAIERERPVDESDEDLGVIITVLGPSSPVTVRKKARVFGIWANVESAIVDSAPSFYALASTGQLSEILSDASNKQASVTVDNAIHIAAGPGGIADPAAYQSAVIRLNRDKGVYFDMIGEVEMVGKTLFQTHIKLPANLVEGNYLAKIFLTKSGEVIDDFQTGIRVQKVGLERWIYNLAHENSLIYGLLSILVALMAGWGASEIFRQLRR